jgi:hypothetical protein
MIARMRMFARVAATLMLAGGAAGCKFPYPEDVPGDGDVAPNTRTLGGEVTGLWTGASITLHLESGEVSEDLAANAADPFTFVHRLEDGASYLVTVASSGPDHACTISNGSGRVDGADIDDLAVSCTNNIPHGLAISTPVPFTFDPRTTRYPLAVSIIQQEVSVTVTGPSLTSAKVAGQDVTLGQPSPPVPLGQGMTTVAIDVAKGPISQRYELVFDRGAAPIVEATYARAFNAGAGDRFGIAVAAAGDWAAIGADSEASSSDGGTDNNTSTSGAVYMYRRSGNGWTAGQKLKGSAIAQSRRFGASLAMYGDVLVVGGPEDDGRGTDAGAVWVFRLDPVMASWREEQRITADAMSYDRFGYAVAVSGDYLAVGSPYHDGGTGNLGDNFGRVQIFRRSGGVWSPEATLQVQPRVAGESFGISVALDGDTIAVQSANRSRVFRRSGTSWVEEATPVIAGSVVTGSVAVEGDELVVETTTYHRTAAQWSVVADLQLDSPVPSPTFGGAVALHGNLIVASLRNDNSLVAWQKVGATWVPAPRLSASQATAQNEFGASIAIGAHGVVIGAHRDPGPGSPGTSDSGTAWFFR